MPCGRAYGAALVTILQVLSLEHHDIETVLQFGAWHDAIGHTDKCFLLSKQDV